MATGNNKPGKATGSVQVSQSGARDTTAKKRDKAPPVASPVPQSSNGLKDHPVVIVITAVAVVAGALITFFNQVVIPNQTARLTNANDKLTEFVNKDRQALLESSRVLSIAAGDLRFASKTITGLSAELYEARMANLFTIGNPYPNGLRKVQVGMPLASVYAAFPKDDIENPKSGLEYVTVKIRNSPFESMAIYYDGQKPYKPITHMAFWLPWELQQKQGDDVMPRLLISAFGQPTAIGIGNYRAWRINKQEDIFCDDNDRYYLVMRDGHFPGNFWFPDAPKEKKK